MVPALVLFLHPPTSCSSLPAYSSNTSDLVLTVTPDGRAPTEYAAELVGRNHDMGLFMGKQSINQYSTYKKQDYACT